MRPTDRSEATSLGAADAQIVCVDTPGELRRDQWLVASQGATSLTNAVFGIALARSSSVRELGAYALALAVFNFAIGLGRSSVFEVMTGLGHLRGRPEYREASTAIGLLGGVAIAGLTVLGGSGARPGLLLLALATPFLVGQDSLRYQAFAGVPRTAFVGDAIWLAATVVGLAAVAGGLPGRATAVTAFWAGGGVLAFGWMERHDGHRVRPARPTLRWWALTRPRSTAFALNFVTGAALGLVTLPAVAAIGGLAAVGEIRGYLTLMGPAIVAVQAANLATLRRVGADDAAGHSGGVSRAMWLISFAAAGILLSCAVGARLLPVRVGTAVIGSSWPAVRHAWLLVFASAILTPPTLAALNAARLRLPATATKVAIAGSVANAAISVGFARHHALEAFIVGNCAYQLAVGAWALSVEFRARRSPHHPPVGSTR